MRNLITLKKAIQYHVSGYLLKPVDEEELLSYLVEIKKNLDLEKTSHHANKKREDRKTYPSCSIR